jgi:hypothetical protein
MVRAETGIGWRTGIRAPSKGIDIVIRSGVTVSGTTPSGTSEPSLEGELRGVTVPAIVRFRVQSDGRFNVLNVPKGTYHLVTDGISRLVVVRTDDLRIDGGRVSPVRAPIQGRVTDQVGAGVAGAVVQAVIRYRGQWTAYNMDWIRSGPDGSFEFRGLRGPPDAPDSVLALLATHGQDVGWLDLPEGSPPSVSEIRLRPTAVSLRVRTMDLVTEAPIEGARVIVTPELQSRRLVQISSALGCAEFSGFVDSSVLPKGLLIPTMLQQVRVFAGYSYFPWRGSVRLEGATEFQVTLRPRPAVTARVVGAEGEPVAGLRILSADGRADTDSRGVFRLLGSRQDSDFSDLRWSRLARTDWRRFPALKPRPGQKGVFVVPSLRQIDLTLRVGAELEGSRIIVMEEGDQVLARDPMGFVDQRGEVALGTLFEGEYLAYAETIGVRSRPWKMIGRFTLARTMGGTATIDLTDKAEKTDATER